RAIGRRHHHGQLAHARDLRRNRVHQHRPRIRGLAARHVESDPVDRQHALPEPRAVGLLVDPGAALLALVVPADAIGCLLERFPPSRRDGVERVLEDGRIETQRRGVGDPEPVEAPRELEQRLVAAPAHVRDDPLHRAHDAGILLRLPRQQPGKPRLEAGLGRIQAVDGRGAARHGVASWAAARSNAAISGAIAACRILSAAWFTIRRAEIGMISSTSTRLFARSVPPVETTSTMASASPTSGASSIEPYSLIRSVCTPLRAKWRVATSTYLVATRRRWPRRTALS